MANTFTVTYQITLNATNKDHANYETVDAYIRRTSPTTLNTVGVSVSSAKINMSGTTFWSSAGNNPYLDFHNYGRAFVSTSVTDKTSISLTTPSGFSLANLLSVGTSDTAIGIYAYKSTSGNVCTYSSINAVLTITATCVQNYSKSSASVTSNVEAGSASQVTFTNSNLANVYHKVTWTFGSSSYTVPTSTGASSASYTIPVSWLTNIPNATYGTASVSVTTYATDGTNLGSDTYSFTITASPSVVPILSISASRIDNGVPSAWGVYVQGKSGITLTATASGAQGSTISQYTISGGASYTQTSNVFIISTISASGSITYTIKVTDSRGRTASVNTTISVEAYAPPSFASSQAFRCTSGGVASETGTYASVKASGTFTSISGKNTCALAVQYGLSTGSAYSSATALQDNTTAVIGGGTIDINASYKIRFTLTDTFSTVEKVVNLGTAAYTVFFRQGGNGVAFGKVSERENALEINSDWGLYHGDDNLAGTVPVSRGGTGATTVAAARNALGLGNTNGALPVANGGTGATTAAAARNALGLGNTSGAVPVANGGTGAADAATARTNLGITLANLGAAASSHNHSGANITSGTIPAARLPFIVQYGSTTITGVSWQSVSFGSAFTSKPIVVVSYAGNAATSGIAVLKTQSENTTGFQVCMAGSSGSGTRTVNWIAVGT
ncbi:MAG: hypothetical protein PHI27_06045 [Eubacteriales bacterium]|nr:hypothetical protein [Eubacteriales bacterium]MDD4513582.1 hypothetical protein [Eubacteriales bacterium]